MGDTLAASRAIETLGQRSKMRSPTPAPTRETTLRGLEAIFQMQAALNWHDHIIANTGSLDETEADFLRALGIGGTGGEL